MRKRDVENEDKVMRENEIDCKIIEVKDDINTADISEEWNILKKCCKKKNATRNNNRFK